MNTIAEYSTTQAALSDLKARWTQIPDTNTKAGYSLVKAGIKELSGYRSKLEAMRKDLKAPILERGKLLDSEAKRINGELLTLETPLKTAKQATDEREQREKEERIARLQVKVNELISYPSRAQGATSAQIGLLIDRLGEIDTSHDYYDLTKEAMDAQAASLDSLSALYQQQVAKEAEEQRMAAERAQQAAERARLDAERQSMIAQQEEQRRQQQAMQEQMDAQRAEMERNQAALDQQKAEADRYLEQQRQLAEQADAEKAAEQRRIQTVEAELMAADVEFDRRAALAEETLPGSDDLATPQQEAPRFVAPVKRAPLARPAAVHFVGRERVIPVPDNCLLGELLGTEELLDMTLDAEGNFYELEVLVRRIRILSTQAA